MDGQLAGVVPVFRLVNGGEEGPRPVAVPGPTAAQGARVPGGLAVATASSARAHYGQHGVAAGGVPQAELVLVKARLSACCEQQQTQHPQSRRNNEDGRAPAQDSLPAGPRPEWGEVADSL